MRSMPVEKAARLLRIFVGAALVCNVIIVYLVPTAVLLDEDSLLGGVWEYVAGFLRPGEDDILSAGLAAGFVAWFWVWKDAEAAALTLFLVVSGICTAVILRQAWRVLGTVIAGTPFSIENAVSLSRAAVSCFVVSGAALARVGFSVGLYRSLLPLASYNALFVPMFAMGGLICFVGAALFRQAAELKAENDLTI